MAAYQPTVMQESEYVHLLQVIWKKKPNLSLKENLVAMLRS